MSPLLARSAANGAAAVYQSQAMLRFAWPSPLACLPMSLDPSHVSWQHRISGQHYCQARSLPTGICILTNWCHCCSWEPAVRWQ